MTKGIHRTIFLFAFLLTSTISRTYLVWGQERPRFGFEVGLNIGQQVFSHDIETENSGITKEPRRGFIVGALYEFSISQPFFFAPELRYIQKGVRYKGFPMIQSGNNPPIGLGDLEYQLEYLEAVATLKVKSGSDKFGISLIAAPALGILLSSHAYQQAYESTGNHFTNNYDISQRTETFEFSMSGGTAIEYNMSAGVSVYISGMYSLGLTDIYVRSGIYDAFSHSEGVLVLGGVLFTL